MKILMTYLKTRKGIALVYVALILAVLLMLAGVAIDVAYMYNVKNQLQVAADSAALAGAATLNGIPNDIVQDTARRETWKFACKNKAASSQVYLVTNSSLDCDNPPPAENLNSANAPDADIVMGIWTEGSGGIVGSFSPTIPTGGVVNAVQAVARKTTDSPNGPARVFLGQIFRVMGIDWSSVSARALAIGSRPLRANGHLTMCYLACTATYPAVDTDERILSTPNISDPLTQMTWTSLLTSPASSSEINKRLLCEHSMFANVCDKNIYTNTDADAFRNLASVFLDPGTPKTECPPIVGAPCPPGGTGWWVMVPITTGAACGSDLVNASTPKNIVSYALVRITRVCPTGCASGGCPDRPPLPNNCNDIPGCSGGGTNNIIVIDRLSCISCSEINNLLGISPVLVK